MVAKSGEPSTKSDILILGGRSALRNVIGTRPRPRRTALPNARLQRSEVSTVDCGYLGGWSFLTALQPVPRHAN